MRSQVLTTLLNPTLWLLGAAAITGIVGAMRGADARTSLRTLLRVATTTPLLLALLGMAAAGVATRLAIARTSLQDRPGGPLAAMNRFLSQQPAAAETWSAFREWRSESSAQQVPWRAERGSVGCPAKAMWSRVPLFTMDASSPALIVAQALVVKHTSVGALRALLLLGCGASLAWICWMLLRTAHLRWRSREGLLLIAAVSAWQPFLAGLRQLDLVLPATALLLASWLSGRNGRWATSGVLAALAACVSAPTAGGVVATTRLVLRSAVVALSVIAGVVTLTAFIAGVHALPGYVMTLVYAINLGPSAGTTYSLVWRYGSADNTMAVLGVVFAAVLVSWWRSRSADDAFASLVPVVLLATPVVWSQHLAIAIVPTVILLERTLRRGSAAAFAAWAVLVATLSLPDPAAQWVSDALGLNTVPPTVAVGAAGPAVLWLWATVSSRTSTRALG